MKERPILFKGEMVRAILDGRKAQTRRIIGEKYIPVIEASERVNGRVVLDTLDYEIVSPYGRTGDRLWVRETWATGWGTMNTTPSKIPPGTYVEYAATPSENAHLFYKWRPSIFVPRWASRIALEIVDVRVERLNSISSDDAWAEGIESEIIDQSVSCRNYAVRDGWFNSWGLEDSPEFIYEPIETIAARSYRSLWEKINGAGSWDANPWVWVVEFKKL